MMIMAMYRPFFQQEVAAVEGVLVVLPALRHRFTKGEFGHAQHVDEMILVLKGGMLAILYLLQVLRPLHLGIEKTVFMNVLFVLDFVRVAELGNRALMLLIQLGNRRAVFLLQQAPFRLGSLR